MNKQTRNMILGILIVTAAASLSLTATAGKEVTVVGVVNEDLQIVDENGTVFEMADNDIAIEVAAHVGRKVMVKGTVMVADGTPIITIVSYVVREE